MFTLSKTFTLGNGVLPNVNTMKNFKQVRVLQPPAFPDMRAEEGKGTQSVSVQLNVAYNRTMQLRQMKGVSATNAVTPADHVKMCK